MKKLMVLFAATLIFLLPSISRAQATRTWVSGVGDDANPGSRDAPCKTFAGAISKTAAGGVIDVLDPGGFGAVTITKSITIEGDGAEGSVLVSGTDGMVINAGTNDVVILRNLTFEGLGNQNTSPAGLSGIKVVSAYSVHVENCRINGFVNNGINFMDGITNGQLYVKDTTIHDCSPAGINLAPTAPSIVLIEGANITDSANGIEAASNTASIVTGTTSSGNANIGFLVGTNAEMTIKDGTVTDNGIGIQSAGEVTLFDSTVAHNVGDGLMVIKPGKIYSGRNNLIFGNSPDGKATGSVSSQ